MSINRRGFFGILAAVPTVGRIKVSPKPPKVIEVQVGIKSLDSSKLLNISLTHYLDRTEAELITFEDVRVRDIVRVRLDHIEFTGEVNRVEIRMYPNAIAKRIVHATDFLKG